jgi:ABC-type bacteriocin/lantibiotic exporter with double-glycine peptidase domain
MADIEKRIDSLAPGTPLERLNVKQLRETIESFGLHAASVRFRASEYANVPPNTILFLRPDKVCGQGVGHVVLLLSVTEEGVVHFVDFTPGVGRQEVSLDQLRTFWDGEAIVVSAKRVTPFWKYAQIVLGVGLLLGAVLMLVRLRRGRPAVNCKK